MSDHWFYGLVAQEEINRLEKQLALRFKFDRERQKSAKERIAALEDDLGRVALLARALADLCLEKGVLTREELVRQLCETDLADGKQDQRLQARVVMPGESKPPDPDPSRDPAARKKRMKRSRPLP